MFLRDIKKLFKKNKPQSKPKTSAKKWIDWGYMLNTLKLRYMKEVRQVEPFTLPAERLKKGAKDKQYQTALKMYNSHLVKLKNQWVNPYNSVNTGYSTIQLSYYNYQTVNYYECYTLAQDPLFTTIFNILSQTPFAKGGRLVDIEKDEQKRLDKLNNKYKVFEKLIKAVRSNYVCGGCLLYLDFGLDNLEEPLNLETMDMRRFKGFQHIDPINVVALDVNTIDPAKENYMDPDKWYIIGLGVVHKSHLLKFEANVPELVMKPLTLYFGMPLTQLIKADVANSSIASQSMVNFLKKLRLNFIKTPDAEFTTTNAENFKHRLEAMALLQDNDSVFPIKQDEELIQINSSLTGFAECVKLSYQLVGAKTSIPTSRILGEEYSGLSGNGDNSKNNFYDTIRNIQFNVKDNLLIMEGIVGGVESGKFIHYSDYLFNPLEEANEKEKAENIKSYSEVAKSLIDLGAKSEDVLTWLKSFKDFNLDNIELDLDTPGLADYDNTEDITEDIVAKVANADFKETDHPRDNDGKFTSEGGSGGSKSNTSDKPIEVKGTELGTYTDIKELRQKAIDYYEKHLANTEVENPELGKILFSKNGFKKPISFSADERKLKLFPYLPEIIKNGKLAEDNTDKHNRSNVLNFYTLKSKINIDGKDEIVRISIRKDNNGKLYYDHVIQNNRGFRKTPSGNKSGGPETSMSNSINDENYIVNMFFEEEIK